MDAPTLEQVPGLIVELNSKIDYLLDTLDKSKPAESSNKPLSVGEAAGILRLSKASIYRLVHERQIPFHKVGNRLHFFESELLEWLKSDQ